MGKHCNASGRGPTLPFESKFPYGSPGKSAGSEMSSTYRGLQHNYGTKD